ASLARTVTRLGGSGLMPDQTTALVSYLAVLPPPRPPTLDHAAVARGKQVFDGAGGCVECHSGPRFTDGTRHRFKSTLELADTPSLIGLSASAPYYHDGSAETLEVLVGGGGEVHGMGDMSELSPAQRADLAVFLSSL
ncbi:MAG: c-type cytochrome, partial [Deltaproteobacteria bacterium]|nr:c-type cytochrome [Deltaproteobacteria bacterium]